MDSEYVNFEQICFQLFFLTLLFGERHNSFLIGFRIHCIWLLSVDLWCRFLSTVLFKGRFGLNNILVMSYKKYRLRVHNPVACGNYFQEKWIVSNKKTGLVRLDLLNWMSYTASDVLGIDLFNEKWVYKVCFSPLWNVVSIWTFHHLIHIRIWRWVRLRPSKISSGW